MTLQTLASGGGDQGTYFDHIDAPAPDDLTKVVRLGIRHEVFRRWGRSAWGTIIAQFYGIIKGMGQPGLVSVRHAFRGLKRGLASGDDMDTDKKVIIYSWRPRWDFEWVGDRFSGKPVPKSPPANEVFVILVRPEPQPNVGNVFGSIDYWNWVKEAPDLPGAPVDWAQRYEEKLRSREI